ncbi:MAG: hypothetical protein RJA99_1192 [Pseudomonadota bacterium]|jgi:uncharacterized membrane protein YedE/YeeE
MPIVAAFACGLVFGLGLILSGMVDPGKVLGFLDLAGAWDPSLALVMGGAVSVAAAGFVLAAPRARSWLGEPTRLPGTRGIDARLVGGSLAFGIGWGLAGFCPGPAFAALLGGGGAKAAVFVASMIAGMALFEAIARRTRSGGTADAAGAANPAE